MQLSLHRIYYQFDVNRLSACPLTIHALLHVADDIEMNGPPCYNWSFVMERYCGLLVPAVKSQKHPFTALSLRQLHITRLNDIRNRYNLHEVLRDLPADNVPSSHDTAWMKCYITVVLGLITVET